MDYWIFILANLLPLKKKNLSNLIIQNIQDLTFVENPFLKYLDLRILKIETAGHSNPKGSDMQLVGIIGAADFKKKVLHQRELLKNETRVGNSQTQTSNEQINKTLIEIRDILNEIKNKS